MENQDFQTAQAMAQDWIKHNTDPNEVAKSLRYLRDHRNSPQFFRYLRTVVNEGRAVVRSGRTLDYYRQIEQVCRQHLSPYQDKPETMAQILGWAVRLMRFHRVAPTLTPPSRIKAKRTTPSKAKLAHPSRINDLQAGMVLTGTVRRIMPYGAFVDIGVDRDGLVHIWERAERRVRSVEEVVSEGEKVTVQVLSVDLRRQRISLSMKGLNRG